MRGNAKARLAAAKAKGAWYADRFKDGMTVEELRAEAKISSDTMGEILRAHGCDTKAGRKDRRLSLAKPYGSTHVSGTRPVRREPNFEAMMNDARSDHD